MVAMVGGSDLGLGTASGQVLGRQGQLGSVGQGRGGEGVTVNAVTGNLVLQRQDEYLAGLGLDLNWVRTYNSQGVFSGDADNRWRIGYTQRIVDVTGDINQAGSTVLWRSADGALLTYTYDSASNSYVNWSGSGAVDTITFDEQTQLFTRTDGDSQRQEIYDVNLFGALTALRDADGHTLTLSYAATGGLLESITDSNGECFQFEYDANENLTAVHTQHVENGVTLTLTRVRYAYDSSNRLTQVIVDLTPDDNSIADGQVYTTTYTYDGAGQRVASLSQSDGSRLEFTYVEVNGEYRIATIRDVRSATDIRTTTYSYDTTNRSTSITDVLGQVTVLAYDEHGQVTAIQTPAVNGVSTSTTFTYDALGNVETVTDARGNTITYEYDTHGNRILERDALGNTVKRVFDANNRLTSETTYSIPDTDGAGPVQPGGGRTDYFVYEGVNLRFQISAEGRVTEYQYSNGLPTVLLRYSGWNAVSSLPTLAAMVSWVASNPVALERVDTHYDARGQVDRVTTYARMNGSGGGIAGTEAVTHFVYDQTGQLLQRIDAREGVTQYTYDGMGRVLTARNAIGEQTTYLYDEAGRSAAVTLANGLVTTTTYDAAGQATSVVQRDSEATLSTTTYAYDALGRLVMETDSLGAKRFHIYDALGRRVGDIDPLGALTEYVYNPNGQLIKQVRYLLPVDAAVLSAAAIDPSSLTLAVARDDQSAVNSRVEWHLYDAAGQLRKTVDATGAVVEYSYDGKGQLITLIQRANGLTGAQREALADYRGDLSSTDPRVTVVGDVNNDRITVNGYSTDGLLLSSRDGDGYWTYYSYDALGRLVKEIRRASTTSATTESANDQHTYYFYNARGQLTDQMSGYLQPATTTPPTPARLIGYLTHYDYDLAGNKTQEVHYANVLNFVVGTALVPPASSLDDQRTTYTYDALNRLATSTASNGLVTTIAGRDVFGNIEGLLQGPSATEGRVQFSTYDSQGRLIRELSPLGYQKLIDLMNSSTWTPEAEQTLWTQYSITYTYDAAGRRTSRSDAAGKTQYFYDAAGRLTYTINALGEVVQNLYNTYGEVEGIWHYSRRLSELGAASGLSAWASWNGGDDTVLANLNGVLSELASDEVDMRYYDHRGAVVTQLQGYLNGSASVSAINYTYNAFGELVERTTLRDLNNDLTVEDTYNYNRRGQLTQSINDSEGLARTTQTQYDAFGRVIQATDARGQIWNTSYDLLGREITLTDPTNATQITTYDGFNRVLTRTDGNGAVTTYHYDTANRTYSVTTAEGITTTTVQNVYGETVSITDGRGQRTEYAYDANGQVISVTTAAGTAQETTTSNVYNSLGQLIETTDVGGTKTVYNFDAAGRVITRVVDPDGLNLTTRSLYDGQGRALWTQDANGTWTHAEYDDLGHVVQVTVDPGQIPDLTQSNPLAVLLNHSDALNLVTTYDYDNRGNTVRVTVGAGSANPQVTQYDYDALNRRVAEHVDPDHLNLTTTYTYDANDNVVAKTDPRGAVTRFVYDSRNELHYQVDATGAVTRRVYDDAGRVVQAIAYADRIGLTGLALNATAANITDRLNTANAAYASSSANHVTYSVYDQDGRARFSIDALGYVTEREYDAAGNVVRLTQYAAHIDMPQERSIATLQNAVDTIANTGNDRTEFLVYDAANRATFHIDAGGYATRYVHDASGRVLREVRYANAVVGNIDPAAEPRVLALGETPPANAAYLVPNAQDQTVRHVYDAAGRERFTIDGEGAITEHRYDALGHEVRRIRYAQTVAQWALSLSDTDTAITLSTHLPLVGAADIDESSQYDEAGRLLATVDGDGHRIEHHYDASGREIEVIVVAESSLASVTRKVYDSAGRLIEQTQGYGSAEAVTTRYVLDKAGNRTAIIDSRGIELAETDSAWAQATRQAWGYPALAANLLDVQKDALRARYTLLQQFDGLGRVTRTTDPTAPDGSAPLPTITRYDAFGNIAQITDPRGNSGYFYFDAGNHAIVQIDPMGYATRHEYNGFGEITASTRYDHAAQSGYAGATSLDIVLTYLVSTTGKDVTTRSEYNTRGLITQQYDGNNNAEVYEYDGFGNRTRRTDRRNNAYDYEYDLANRLVREYSPAVDVAGVDANGVVSTTSQRLRNEYDYDAFGNRVTLREAVGTTQQRTTQIGYDKLGRAVRTDLPAVTVFNPVTRTSSTVNPYLQTTYDARGNVVEERDANGNRTLSYYDALNRRIAVIDATGALREYQYDDAGNVVRERAYDTPLVVGNQTWQTLPIPAANDTYRETSYAWDANNRLVGTRTQAETLFDVNDIRGGGVGYVTQPVYTQNIYDANGNLVRSIDGRGYVSVYFYDALGQQILAVSPAYFINGNGEQKASEGYVVQRDYDALGQLIRETYYEQKLSDATLETLGEHSDVNTLIAEVQATQGQDRITEYAYNRIGLKTAERKLSVRYSTVAANGQITQHEDTVETLYTYDNNGNLLSVRPDLQTTDYSYDALNRLTGQLDPTSTVLAGYTGNTVQTASVRAQTAWKYDALGNRVLETRYGLTAAADQVRKFRFDANGHLISEWDALGNKASYDVDANGNIQRERRSALEANGTTSHTFNTYYLYDALGRETSRQIITDEGQAGQVTSQRVWTNYNTHGQVSARGIDNKTQQEYRYDKLGRLFWTNEETGTPRIYLYDANGNAVVEMASVNNAAVLAATGIDIKNIQSPGQAQGLSPQNVQMTLSLYNARNLVTDVFQAPMVFEELLRELTVPQQAALTDDGDDNTPGSMQTVGGSSSGTTTNFATTKTLPSTVTYTYTPGGGVSTNKVYLDPTQVDQANHGQDPISLEPWSTTDTVNDPPTTVVSGNTTTVTEVTRIITKNRMAVLNGTTVNETIVTTTDIISKITTTVVADPYDDIDYVNGTGTVHEKTTTTTQTTTDRTVDTATNTYRSVQASTVENTELLSNTQLNYIPSQAIRWHKEFDNNMSTWEFYLGAYIDVPAISGYGTGPAHIRIEEYRSGQITAAREYDFNQAQSFRFDYYTDQLKIKIWKGGILVLDVQSTSIPGFRASASPETKIYGYGYTRPAVAVMGTDNTIKSATMALGNGAPVQLTKGSNGAGWILQDVNANAGAWEYRLYNSTTQNDSTLVGGSKGPAVNNPGNRSYLYRTTTTTSYSWEITQSSADVVQQQVDTIQAWEQRNYLRQLMYSISSGGTRSNQIWRRQTYNAFGEVDSETDGRGNTTYLYYNELGELIRKEDPNVSYTDEHGVVHQNFMPVTEYYFDALGQTVGQKDANGFITSQLLSNGRLTRLINPNNLGTEQYYYDIFGNMVAVVNGLNQTTRYQYDKKNQLTRTDFQGGNYDIYEYDALGNRIAHTNGLGYRETYLFDGEGRIRRYTSFEGRVTRYDYTFLESIGESGGYRTVTIDAMGNSQYEDRDAFGKIRYHVDLGGHIYNYWYNDAGWLMKQTNSEGQNIEYEYYANGYVRAINDHGIDSYSYFEYDVEGNRTLESYAQVTLVPGEQVQGKFVYQMAHATYDALNRLTAVSENDKFSITYEYDKVGNRRRVRSEYFDLLAGTQQLQDFYYTYDAMNRFTTTMGTLDGSGNIVRGSTGYDIAYNSAGQRSAQASTASDGSVIQERYVYDDNGFLTEVRIKPSATAAEVLRAARANNAVGDRIGYAEYNALGVGTSYHTYTYDKDHNLMQDHDVINNRGVIYTLLADGRLDKSNTYNNADEDAAVVTNTFTYEKWDSYLQSSNTVAGAASGLDGVWKNGVSTFTYDVNGHVKELYDHYEERYIEYANNQNGQTLKRYDFDSDDLYKPVSVRQFYYFNGRPIGDQGTDNVPSRVDYAQTLRDSELEGNRNKKYIKSQNLVAAPALWRQMAAGNTVSQVMLNNMQGKISDRQHQDIATRVIPVTSADFDQNFQPINRDYPGATPSSYVVKEGDTLSTIAASVWGDSRMWYLIADANGLSGSETLVPNQRLTIPNVVTNIHNASDTFRVYEPGLTLGDIQPTLPPPPPPKANNDGGCGGIGQILVLVVTVVVAFYAPQLLPMLMPSNFIGAAAVSMAIGNAAGQVVGMATGVQQGFSWESVAMSAVAGAVTAGVGNMGMFNAIPSAIGQAAAQAAVSSVITQGIGVATGLQKKFSWTAVAASAVGAGIGRGVSDGLAAAGLGSNLDDVFGIFARETLSSLANGAAQALVSRQQPDWSLIAAQSVTQGFMNTKATGAGGQQGSGDGSEGERRAGQSKRAHADGELELNSLVTETEAIQMADRIADKNRQQLDASARTQSTPAFSLSSVEPGSGYADLSNYLSGTLSGPIDYKDYDPKSAVIRDQLASLDRDARMLLLVAGQPNYKDQLGADALWGYAHSQNATGLERVGNFLAGAFRNGTAATIQFGAEMLRNPVATTTHMVNSVVELASDVGGAAFGDEMSAWNLATRWDSAERGVAQWLGRVESQWNAGDSYNLGASFSAFAPMAGLPKVQGVLGALGSGAYDFTKFTTKALAESYFEGPRVGSWFAQKGVLNLDVFVTNKTGTIWDSINSAGAVHPGSVIPRNFELTLDSGQKVWVDGNATKHIAEYAAAKAENFTPESVRLASQEQLRSLSSAVNTAMESGINYRQMMKVDGWELVFARPKSAEQLPALYHALYKAE